MRNSNINEEIKYAKKFWDDTVVHNKKTYERQYTVVKSARILPNGETFPESQDKFFMNIPENSDLLKEIERFQSKENDKEKYEYAQGIEEIVYEGDKLYVPFITAIAEGKTKSTRILVDNRDHPQYPYIIILNPRTGFSELEEDKESMSAYQPILIWLAREVNPTTLYDYKYAEVMRFFKDEILRHCNDPGFIQNLKKQARELVEQKLQDKPQHVQDKIHILMEHFEYILDGATFDDFEPIVRPLEYVANWGFNINFPFKPCKTCNKYWDTSVLLDEYIHVLDHHQIL